MHTITSAGEAPFRLALSRVPGFSVARLAELLPDFGSAQALWTASERSLAGLKQGPALLEARRRLDPHRLHDEALRICQVVFHGDAAYPLVLASIGCPPPVLYARGRVDLLQAPGVAIVGTRGASDYGQRAAAAFARELARAGLCITSGMARGVDSCAHQAALDAAGATIAVLGCGVDVCYPPDARALKRDIEASGLVLSQFAPGEPPLPAHFPARNRVVSGLSRAVLVVEAGEKSGALITAACALDEDRPVFVVPGSVFRPGNSGGHRLVTDGVAVLAHGPQDLLVELGLKPAPAAPPATLDNLDEDARAVLDVIREASLDGDPVEVEEIARRSGIAPSSVVRALTRMELEGLLCRLPGNRYRLPIGRG